MVPLIIASVFQIIAFIIGALYLGARMRRLASQETRLVALRDEIEALAAEFGKASAQAIGRLEALRSPRPAQDSPASGDEPHPGPEYRSRSTEFYTASGQAYASAPDDTAPVPLSLRDESRRAGQELRPAYGQPSPDQGNIRPPVPQNGAYHGRQGPESSSPIRSPREEAIELYRSGLGSSAIAARLGLSVAEVELIASLEDGKGD